MTNPVTASAARAHSGLLVTFEGQDGSGKTTLLEEAGKYLSSRGHQVVTVGEFSSWHSGRCILEVMRDNKFLRTPHSCPYDMSVLMMLLADWTYLVEVEIVPHLKRGAIVLKDRGPDSIVACQVPTLVDVYRCRQDALVERLEAIAHLGPAWPDVTFYLDVPIATRSRRIRDRVQKHIEANATRVNHEDLAVFDKREKVYRALARRDVSRFIVFNNDVALDHAAAQVSAIVFERLTGLPDRTAASR